MAKKKKSGWKASLVIGVVAIVLLSAVATFDVLVLGPARLEAERQARREAPPKLSRPGLKPDGVSGPGASSDGEVLTAFRISEWRLREIPKTDPLEWSGDASDVYLNGYLAVRRAAELRDQGDLAAARSEFETAAKVFGMISERQPDFEPAMVDYRRKKIAEALNELPEAAADDSANQAEAVAPGGPDPAIEPAENGGATE